MRILYIGHYTEEETFRAVLERNVKNMSQASRNFEQSIISAFHEQLGGRAEFVSHVPADASMDLPGTFTAGGAEITQFPVAKGDPRDAVRKMKAFSRHLRKVCEKQPDEPLFVVMYAVNPLFMVPLLRYRRKYGYRMVTVCSEVPAFRRYGTSLKARAAKKLLTFFNEKFDGYIFFSEKMKEIVRTKGKPWITVEGIAGYAFTEPKAGRKNIVMYAGGLAPDNNVPLLIEACSQAEGLDGAWICGRGKDAEKVRQLAEENPKVKYFGTVSHGEAVRMETEAKVLVNLRSPDNALTRYSFPSKILEYIASGTAVLSTRLEGIPEEYFDYITGLDEISVPAAAEAISRIFAMDDAAYTEACRKAQRFVKENKAPGVQAARIIRFLSEEFAGTRRRT